jgi:hypothetical protein
MTILRASNQWLKCRGINFSRGINFPRPLYYWYKIEFFDETPEDTVNIKLRQFPWIT